MTRSPNLMIITDDVYGTFSPHFRSFMAEISRERYISLEDDLMRLFGSERLISMFNTLGIPEGQEIEHKALTNAIGVSSTMGPGVKVDVQTLN